MKTVNLRSFRTYYRERIEEEPDAERIDEHFVGTVIRLPGKGRKTFGFFKMYHGDKEDIRTYLPSLLKIAEDEQAFYEFAQNAVDAQSTHFWAFYNERYFIVLNNGEPFNFEGLRSILNIAQSTKKERCDKIGRFGIGFKLVHRLVGKGDGNHELLEKYKGPVLFSWHRPEQLQSLINGEEVQFAEEQTADNLAGTFADYPLLTKILLTNFPAGVGETVKNLNYEDLTPFSHEEYAQMCAALQEVTRQYRLDFSPFSQGSLFFIDLGENKHELLQRNEEDLRIGMEYSMNFLKKLENIRINECYLHRKEILTEHFTIKTDEALFREIEPESKECDIHIAFGYHKQEEYEDKSKVDYIKQSPNFYKFFPMGDETNKFAFILHSDAFGMEANRRKMQNDHVNRHLLPAFADMLEKRMDQLTQTEEGYERYRAIFLSILLSEPPEEQRNEWYNSVLYAPLLEAIKKRVPTAEGITVKSSEMVKIKDTQLQVNPSEWGAADSKGRPYYWFAWEYHRGSHIIKYAIDKLKLERWNALNLIEHGEVRQINIQLNVKPQNRKILWQELFKKNKSDFSNETLRDKLYEISLFHQAEDDVFYSLNDLSKNTDILLLPHEYAGLEAFKKDLNLKCILLSEQESESEFFKAVIAPALPYLNNPKELKELLFDGEHILKKICDLSLPLRRDYVLWLKRVNLCKIDDLREKAIFENRRGERLPLSKMLLPSEETPDFLKPFEIHPDAFSADFKRELLHKAEDIYTHLLFERWEDITQGIIDSAGNDTEATISKLVALYEYTQKTHKQAKEEAAQANRIPNLPDFKNTDKAYILDYDGTLRGENEIYYNAQLSCFYKEKGKEAYEQLHVFVSQRMNVALPHPQMLRFLREPFGTTPLAFEEWGWEKLRQCPAEIIDTLFTLLEYQEKDLFQYFVLAEVSGGYQLHQRHDSSYLNYISGYDAEKQYIRDYHADMLYCCTPSL
ncbi:MAG: hypothetical protein KatS3mg033_0647 [Thermonema sp.]|uniref:sacsin N-terminal ATP-binding-like domain-containing protein n=1 Tax=Thermonema sp. TaxID=2231181 RepID=UPI0021DEC6FD|nr:hypothetical protein [Thermonema sp.]GIV38847.1 MAG: hypothetical protein KatS3mg033_0647 [Thermonema sp.]